MAEYINREDVDFYCSYSGDCMGSGSECDKCTDNVIEYPNFMEIPNADVVEREKYDLLKRQLMDAWNRINELDKLNGHMREQIDKAIEEITNLRQQYPNEDYYDCKWEILEILKNNIGE